MHIKSLKIQGFKSYRDETVVDPFSPGLNLLVGRNGSGKSNFFSAIRFVLSDAYTSLTREERQALLHDGSTGGGAGGGATMSAYVEIEFDNSDGRFPTNKPTLLLRRTIGLKKDEYQVDRKSTSKGDVMSVLESAGFSRSNPYYIVPQGRITHLTNQKDQDRLLLLKEVAGTKVYEERRAESTKIIEETKQKREKIDDLLTFINDRLSELEEEKEELKQFHTADRSRRSLEYSIYQRELKDIGEALETIEEERRRDVDTANARRSEFTNREKEVSELDTNIATQKQRLEILRIDHRQSSADRRDATKAKAQIECVVRDAEDAGKQGKDRLVQLEKDLKKVETQISEKETELMEAVPAWEDKVAQEVKVKERLEVAETTLRTLYAKRGRVSQFKNQKDRDDHLRTTIAEQAKYISSHEATEAQVSRDLQLAKEALSELDGRVKELRGEMDGRKSTLAKLTAELSKLKDKEAEALEKRKTLWKEETRMSSTVGHAAEQLKLAERTLSSAMDKDTNRGLKAARAIAERLDLDGYYGALYELFTVEDRYTTAVEVTAGNSLFQIVVDTDETATKILEIMLKEKSGRVTFIPLNRLKHQNVEYPNAKDAIPLIKRLVFDKKYTGAFEQVFGKTIVCQSLEIAGAFTRSHNLNSITLDGDKYDRKGSLTGGYHDVRRSRLDAIKTLKQWQAKHEEDTTGLKEARTTLSRLDQEITQLVGEIQVAEGTRTRVHNEREPMVAELLRAQDDETASRDRIMRLQTKLDEQKSTIRNLKLETVAYEAELKTKMQQTLSDAEQKQISALSDESDQAKKELVELSKQTTKLASQKSLLEIELAEALRPRREELRGKIESFDSNGADNSSNEDINARRKEVKALEKSIEEYGKKIDDIDTEVESLTSQIAALEKEREKKDGQQAEDGRDIARQQKAVERYLAKRQLLTVRRDVCNKNIRDLGVLPEEAFAENTASSEKLLKKLKKVNEVLKGFTGVNKKAYEQYTSFTKQRDELIERQTELETSSDSIEELIVALDQRKDEAIERTFKQVGKYFAEVFEKLVPAGKGRLIMQRRELEDEMDVDGEGAKDGVESYTGVAIRVSFNSKVNEGLKIQQLSGGQKALVALAMIFAIQKCDPAPFYLFDEIDANLDADRRTGVAAMIRELSETGQYICTTFRPELIPHAESFFGVVFNATKISNVKAITADECMSFVDAAEQVRA